MPLYSLSILTLIPPASSSLQWRPRPSSVLPAVTATASRRPREALLLARRARLALLLPLLLPLGPRVRCRRRTRGRPASSADRTRRPHIAAGDSDDGGGDADAAKVEPVSGGDGVDGRGAPSRSQKLFARLRSSEVRAEIARVAQILEADPLPSHAGPRADLRVVYGRPSPGAPAVAAPAKPLKLHRVFGNRKPVRLEVCSGHGDWIATRAAEDPESNWIGLEMRPDRVFLIWSKMVLAQADRANMMVLGGTAEDTMAAQLAAGSVEEVFVNCSDPPVWHGSRMRLIDDAFLAQAHRVLAPSKQLVIVTDDAAYASAIVRQLGLSAALFRSAIHPRPFEALPAGYGSSYFDRMWTNGNHRDRYYMRYVRLDPEA